MASRKAQLYWWAEHESTKKQYTAVYGNLFTSAQVFESRLTPAYNSSQAFAFRLLDLARNAMTSPNGRQSEREGNAWLLGWVYTKSRLKANPRFCLLSSV